VPGIYHRIRAFPIANPPPSAAHPPPALASAVFRERTSAAANAATLLYGIGFFAMLFANVLFLTGVWGYSTLKAGFAITPAPLVVASLSSRTGRLAVLVLVFASVAPVLAQSPPAVMNLPVSQNWGTTNFTTLPTGFAAWAGLAGTSITTQALAESSAL